MNFTTREEYLAVTAIWKESYKSIAIDIRQARAEYKLTQQSFSQCGLFDWKNNSQSPHNKAWMMAQAIMHRALSHYEKLKSQATEMIEERVKAKKEAGRQLKLAKAK